MSRSRSRRRRIATAVVLVVTGAAGCGEDRTPVGSPPPAAGRSSAGGPSAGTADGRAPGGSSPTAEAGRASPGVGSSDLVLQPGDFVDVTPTGDLSDSFQSPTGNIQCVFVAGQDPVAFVECAVLEAAWSAPEDPTCDLDWAGNELSLSDDVDVGSCRGDTFLQQDPPTLEYGQGWRAGPLACMSRQDGVICSNAETGHGFRVARASYDVF